MWVLHVADITTTMSSCRENNRLLLYKHPRKGTNIWSGQLDDNLVRWKKNFINISFKEEKFQTRIFKTNFNEL
jgi:hypothetical protein